MKLINNTKGWKVFIAITSIVAGVHFLISPESINPYIIRGIGFIWLLEGVVKIIPLKDNEDTK